MKRIFVLINISIILSTNIFAEYITPIHTGSITTFNNWIYTDCGQGSVSSNDYIQMLKATSLLETPTMDFNSYTSEALNFKARTYGNPSTEQATITISISTNNGISWTALGTRLPTSTTLTAMTSFDLSPYDGTEVLIKFETLGASSSKGVGVDDVEITGMAPSLSVTSSSLTSFFYIEGSGPSTYQTYNLSGSNLTGYPGNITISAPLDYEVSTDNINYNSNAIVAYTTSTLSATTMYVRLKSGLNTGNYNNEGVTNSGGGASSQIVTCSGDVINSWFNEFHYDNEGTDVNEFVEVIIESPSLFNLSDFAVYLYNGGDGTTYGNNTIDNFTSSSDIVEGGKTFRVYYYNFTTTTPLQNGSPDGLAFSYKNSLIQFLSYEGTFTGSAGIANGILSMDIGLNETGTSTTPTGSSIGLTGFGTKYSDFTWTSYISSATPGENNGSQALPVELSSFTSVIKGNDVVLKWSTATEVNNYGFEIERSPSPTPSLWEGALTPLWGDWGAIGFVNGNGNSNSIKEYSFTDNTLTASGKYFYRLKQIDTDGKFEYSNAIKVNFTGENGFNLAQNYPNPFNPVTVINYQLPANSYVTLKVFDLLGKEVTTLVNGNMDAGNHNVNFNASSLSAGTYFYKLKAGDYTSVKKLMVVK
ncbi:MAG: T9SS C-terminal target domain-containing protein [Ignavibacteriales bacterium]|nr:MAG: T9SS C-terminal target domain-containing protein [Ignavibacteriales bacterium]